MMEKGLAKTGEQPARSAQRAGCPHPHDPELRVAPNADERLNWAVAKCEKLQLRNTDARAEILRCLAGVRIPMSLAMIEQALAARFNAATIYRTMMLLKDLDVVRQITVDHKTRYFVLNSPDQSSAYLVCDCCGDVTPLTTSHIDEQRALEVARLGYANVGQLLELRGLCPRCHAKPGATHRSAKLPVRC